MTLQNGLIHGERAYMWADTAYYDGRSGELLGYHSKCCQGLYWPWAAAFSSLGGNPHEIVREIGEDWRPTDVPSLLTATTAALRSYAAQGYSARVLLAAWEGRPQLWLVRTDDCADEGAFVPCEVIHYLNTGNEVRGSTTGRFARA